MRFLLSAMLLLSVGAACSPSGGLDIGQIFGVSDAELVAARRVGFIVHRVAAGETLASIAKHYSGDRELWKRIRDFNPRIDPNRIEVGDRIKIPVDMLRRRRKLQSEPGVPTATNTPTPTMTPVAASTPDRAPPDAGPREPLAGDEFVLGEALPDSNAEAAPTFAAQPSPAAERRDTEDLVLPDHEADGSAGSPASTAAEGPPPSRIRDVVPPARVAEVESFATAVAPAVSDPREIPRRVTPATEISEEEILRQEIEDIPPLVVPPIVAVPTTVLPTPTVVNLQQREEEELRKRYEQLMKQLDDRP